MVDVRLYGYIRLSGYIGYWICIDVCVLVIDGDNIYVCPVFGNVINFFFKNKLIKSSGGP